MSELLEFTEHVLSEKLAENIIDIDMPADAVGIDLHFAQLLAEWYGIGDDRQILFAGKISGK